MKYRLTDLSRTSGTRIDGFREYDWVAKDDCSGTVHKTRAGMWKAEGGYIGGETFEAAGKTRNEATHTASRMARRDRAERFVHPDRGMQTA